MKSLKKNVILILTLSLTILLGAFAGMLFSKQKNKVFAAEGVSLTVQKVKLYEATSDEKYVAYYFYKDTTKTPDDIDSDNKAIFSGVYKYDASKDEFVYYETYEIENYSPTQNYGLLDRELKIVQINFDELLSDENPIFNGEFRKATAYDKSVIQEIAEDDNIFMLKNANLENGEINLDECSDETKNRMQGKSFETKEYLLVMLKNNQNSKLLSLASNATLSNSLKSESVLNISPLEKTSTSQTISYCQLFDLNNTWILDTTAAGGFGDNLNEYDAQGKYNFTFRYNINNNGIVTTNNVVSTEFYLINEKYYINPIVTVAENVKDRSNVSNLSLVNDKIKTIKISETEQKENIIFNRIYNNAFVDESLKNYKQTEPRFINTERLDIQFFSDEYAVEKNYFYFNNHTTTDYDGEKTVLEEDKILQYPKIVYDASRYNLSYVKTMFGITTNVTSYLDFTDANNVKLILCYNNGTNSWTETQDVTIEGNLFKQYIAEIEFNEVGKYVLAFDLVLKNSILSYSESDRLFVKNENWDLLHNNELNIFGYQLMHSVYGDRNNTTEKEMKDTKLGIFSDISNKNDIEDIPSSVTNFANGDYPLNIYGNTITKTNQPPILFNYNASLNTTIENSFYLKYVKNNDKYVAVLNGGLPKKHELTSNIKFTESGMYIVLLQFELQDYEHFILNDNVFEKSNLEDQKYQIFIFEIANEEPKIKFYEHLYKKINQNEIDFDKDNTYELINNAYILTQDAEYDSTKTYYYLQKNILTTGGFTNASVEINWADTLINPFDIKPKVSVYEQSFDTNATATPMIFEKKDIEKGIVIVNNSKKYIVKIEYGPCTYVENLQTYIYSASITSMFIIDKEDIGVDENIVRFYEDNNNTGFTEPEKITNKNFAVIYGTIDLDNTNENKVTTTGKKRSGAKISVNYSFLPITPNNYPVDTIIDADNLYVPNGAAILSKNDKVAYNQSAVSKILGNGSNVLSNDGIYIFEFKDEAGNSTKKYIIKDTTSPLLLQYLEENGEGTYSVLPNSSSYRENMVNIDAKIIWGKYKAIKFDLPTQIQTSIVDELKSNNVGYTIQKINNVDYLIINLNSSVSTPNYQGYYDSIPKNSTTIYYQQNGYYIAPKQDNIEYAGNPVNCVTIKTRDSNNQELLENEHLFKIRIYDALGNNFEGKIEITFDKSMLKAHISGLPGNNIQLINSNSSFETDGEVISKTLYEEEVTNKKLLSFSWIDGTGDYTVKSVSCEYYPITYEEIDSNNNLNSNYPYSPTPTQIINLMQNTTQEIMSTELNNSNLNIVKRKTPSINLVQDDRYNGELSTVQGMYKIIRTYEKINPETNKNEERVYTFYIDRNNIISRIDENRYIGSDIKIKLGNGDDEYLFAGKDFLQDFIDDYLFVTNKQPNTLEIPLYKYYYKGIDARLLEKDASKIAINRLSAEINNRLVNNFDVNTFIGNNSENEVLFYNIKLYDNSGDKIETTNYQNQIDFQIAVNLYPPKANYMENGSTIALTEGANNYISANNTNVSLVWNVDESGINAKIDETDIKITQTLENGRTNILYDKNNASIVNNLVSVDGNKRYIDFSKFYSQINGINCRIEVTLKYIVGTTNYYGSYLSTKKIMYFDFEKPQTNFDILFNNDTYLKAQNISKSEFENYESPISFDNYTFVVDSDFKLIVPKRSTFWQNELDSSVTTNPNDNDSSVWYRAYEKYLDDKSVNLQSIVEGDDRYNDSTRAPNRLMFNAYTGSNNSADTSVTYTKISTTIDKHIFAPGFYYEIIEKDCANNFRIYTIYVAPENGSKILYTETIDYGDGTYKTEQIITDKINYEINNQRAILTGFESLGNWFDIELLDGSNNTSILNTIKVAPVSINGYVTLNSALSIINENIIDIDGTGRHFVIKIISSNHANIIINYRTPGQSYVLDSILSATSLTIRIDNRFVSTYLANLEIIEIDNNGNEQLLQLDDSGTRILTEYNTTTEPISYKFLFSANKVRNLWLIYSDNFGVQYRDNFILGITQTPFENMLTFNDTYVQNLNYTPKSFEEVITDYTKYAEYYTASNVVLTYQPKIYSIIGLYYINEYDELIKINIDTNNSISDSINTKRISIFQANENNMQDIQYFVIFKDTSNKFYQFSLHHYKKVAELQFLDSSYFEHNFEKGNIQAETLISRPVYIKFNEYDENASYPIKTFVTATRSYINESNITVTENLGQIKSEEYTFNKVGRYTVIARSELGIEKVYEFEYIESDAIYYSVKANINGKMTNIYPSEVKMYYDGEYVDHYVSIYEASVFVNQKKNLKVEEETSGQIVQTRIYKISSLNKSTSYKPRRIAITKVSSTSNILGERATITQYKIIEGEDTPETQSLSSKYLKSNSKKVILSIPAYNQNEIDIKSNLLKVRVVYNNRDLGYVNLNSDGETASIEFTVAGQYKIYVYDLAGNQHSFGGTAYFELSLINNFIYTLNGNKGIYNSIFNNEVQLGIEQTSYFVNDSNGNSYTLTATLNGSNYPYTYQNGKYIFNSYGTYLVTLKGYLNKDANGNYIDEVITIVKFTILNANEARLMHEYIGLNGYEVTKIVKNNEDVTDNIRERLNSATITKFMISGLKDGIGGSGRYDITVNAYLDKIVGESQFTYSVWINNDNELLIIPSIAKGDSTTKDITLKFNMYQIYSKVGECKLKINANTSIDINNITSENNTITTLTLTKNSRYNVTLETLDGNTITSFIVTKVEPLNTVAIIIIIVASVVVAGLALTFILLRKKMRVR